MDDVPVLPTGRCPVCDADDTYLGQRADRDEYFVECLNCGVYMATRKAFRHFEYLRWRAQPEGVERLAELAQYLKTRPRGILTKLEYDTWQHLLPSKPIDSVHTKPGGKK